MSLDSVLRDTIKMFTTDYHQQAVCLFFVSVPARRFHGFTNVSS
jgi:hypothetical protein